MSDVYNRTELSDLGFDAIGKNVIVSKDARFFAIQGSLGNNVRIDAYAILTGHIELGDNVHISPFCFMGGTGGYIKMDDNSGLSSHVSIFTKSAAGYTAYELDNDDKIEGSVHIGKNTIIGSGSRIMPNVKISEDVSVSCNCVINHNIEKGAIIISRGMGLITASNRSS